MDPDKLQRIQSAICAFNSKMFNDGSLSLDAWLEIITEDLVPRAPESLRYFTLDDLSSRQNAGTGIECLLHLWDGASGWLDYSGYNGDKGPSLFLEQTFYELKLPREAVTLVDSREAFLNAMDVLAAADILGMDGEWKPDVVHTEEGLSRLSVFQFATRSRIFLLDFPQLRKILPAENWQRLADIFASPKIVKLGFAFQGDFSRLREIEVFSEESTNNYPNFFDVKVVTKRLAFLKPEIFGKKVTKEVSGGLSGIVHALFGRPLDKREQISNWERRPLRDTQRLYAALDAFSLIEIWDTLHERCLERNIPFLPGGPGGPREVGGHPSVAEEELATELAAFPVINQDEPINPSSIKLICDGHLKGLSRRLRNIGVDTEYADGTWTEQRLLSAAVAEDRIFLTSPARWKFVRKQLPRGCCFYVSNSVKSIRQLEYVVRMFNIAITKDAVLSRCSACNGDTFIHADREEVLCLVRHLAPDSACAALDSHREPALDSHGDPRLSDTPLSEASAEFAACFKKIVKAKDAVDFSSGKVKKTGVLIDVTALQEYKMRRVAEFFVCSSCGKIYWPGTHFRRTWHFLIANKLV